MEWAYEAMMDAKNEYPEHSPMRDCDIDYICSECCLGKHASCLYPTTAIECGHEVRCDCVACYRERVEKAEKLAADALDVSEDTFRRAEKAEAERDEARREDSAVDRLMDVIRHQRERDVARFIELGGERDHLMGERTFYLLGADVDAALKAAQEGE